MEIVITNDDGIDAPGIKALYESIQGNKIIIAPKDHHSGCGHQVTTYKPLSITRISKREIAVHGTPADCTRLALTHLAKNSDWVISGINAGGNLGVDLYISGTAAAAREAAILGKKAIAISQRIKDSKPIDWAITKEFARLVISELLTKPLPAKSFWNVNLPHIISEEQKPKLVYCEPSSDPLPTEFRLDGDTFYYTGNYGNRDRSKGTDVDICFSGDIAISLIKV